MPRKPINKKVSPPPPKKTRDNPFKDAVDAASKQLEMALEEQSLCHNKLAHLAVLIPKLERTVMALKDQMSPHEIARMPQMINGPQMIQYQGMQAPVAQPPIPPNALWKERNLSGLGSIPPVQGAPQVPVSLSDDELLSDELSDEGEVLL